MARRRTRSRRSRRLSSYRVYRGNAQRRSGYFGHFRSPGLNKWRNAIHSFKRISSSAPYQYTLNATGGAIQYPTLYFQLANVQAYTEFTALYDQYRIKGVQLTFFWSDDQASYNINTSANARSQWMVLADYDDATALTAGDALEYPNVKILNTTGKYKMFIRPRPALAAYSGAFTSYAQAPKNQWLDCGSTGIQHYGIKMVLPTGGATGYTPVLNVYVKYYIQFRGIR